MSLPDFKYKQSIFYFSSKEKSKLKFKADNIVIINEKGETKIQHSCHRLFALFIIGNITITSPLLQKAKKFGFPVILLNYNLKPQTIFNNRAEGNFLLRKKQYTTKERDFDIAKQLITQKINNQISLLKTIRYQAQKDKKTIEKLSAISCQLVNNSTELLGIEGTASKLFFQAYFRQLNWIRREPRTKRDINNLLLDIGYTYLFNFVEALVGIYGFDIYCGVYHKFFYQRKSLICDLVEPFRSIIDRRLRKAHNLNQIDKQDFFQRNNQYVLTYKKQKKYTALFFKDILAEKNHIFTYIQQYYRWYMKTKTIEQFPIYTITPNI